MKKPAAIVFGLALMLGGACAAQAQTEGSAEAGAQKIQVCVACHGQSGNDSTLPTAPRIGGQNASYLFKQLVEIKAMERVVPEMTGMLDNFSEQDLADMAVHYASQEAPLGAANPELVALGEKIYRSGIHELGVAACSACHSPTGSGNAPAVFPRLSGQLTAYTEKQLRDFRSGTRVNDEAAVMRTLSKRLTDEEIAALASYLAGLR